MSIVNRSPLQPFNFSTALPVGLVNPTYTIYSPEVFNKLTPHPSPLTCTVFRKQAHKANSSPVRFAPQGEREQSFTPHSSHFTYKKSAFTLAEVLITLGIIGVVAAMTLPTLVQNHRNTELQTGLKKAYSVLSQALDLYYAKNGERIKPDGTVASQGLKKIIMPYFINAKDCGTGSGSSENAAKACVPNNSYVDEDIRKADIYKTYNGNKANMAFFDDGQFVINDGMLVLIENTGGSTTLYLSVDVNGYNKKPNRVGHDLFMFQIDKNGMLRPMGADETNYPLKVYPDYCSPAATHNRNGTSCTHKALTDPDYFKNLPK